MKTTYVLFIVLLTLTFLSCKREIEELQSKSAPDVYVAGYQYKGIHSIATLWKNGIARNLTDGTKNAYAFSVFMVNEDIYVVGSDNLEPIMWKNGVRTKLPLLAGYISGHAQSIYISGSNIFIAGSQNDGHDNAAVLWKNGVATKLNNTKGDAAARAVYAVGDDVFIAGYQNPYINIGEMGVRWKNNFIGLPMPEGGNSMANSIFVQDNDVFIVGDANIGNGRTEAKLWKNNKPFYSLSLADGTGARNISSAESVYVVGTSIYIAGYIVNPITKNYEATLWENAVETILPLTVGGSFSWGHSVYVSGSDIYVAGYQNKNGKRIATVWKNKLSITNLTDGTNEAEAFSIFVK